MKSYQFRWTILANAFWTKHVGNLNIQHDLGNSNMKKKKKHYLIWCFCEAFLHISWPSSAGGVAQLSCMGKMFCYVQNDWSKLAKGHYHLMSFPLPHLLHHTQPQSSKFCLWPEDIFGKQLEKSFQMSFSRLVSCAKLKRKWSQTSPKRCLLCCLKGFPASSVSSSGHIYSGRLQFLTERRREGMSHES